MSSWIKVVPVEETLDDKFYFIARAHNDNNTSFSFWSTYLNGKSNWSVKPGIANQYHGGENLAKAFKSNEHITLVAIEVPADADKRWKKRKHSRR